MEIVSCNIVDSFYQGIYEGMTDLFYANMEFRNEKTFLKNMLDTFEYGFTDAILYTKIIQKWINKGYLITKFYEEDNNLKNPLYNEFFINSVLKKN